MKTKTRSKYNKNCVKCFRNNVLLLNRGSAKHHIEPVE